MMLVGQLTDSIGACRYDEARPGGPLGFTVRTRYAVETTDVRQFAADCPITDRHHGGRRLGTVRHAETTALGHTFIVADLDSLDVRSDREGQLFLSLEGRVSDGMIDVTRVVLTGAPAQPLKPIRIFGAGTVARLPEASVLRLRRTDPFVAGLLLERALAATRGRKRDEPLRVRSASHAGDVEG
jgi:hypothetical protein